MSNNTAVNWEKVYKKFDHSLLNKFLSLTGNTSKLTKGKVPDDVKKAMLMISYILWGLKLGTINQASLKQLMGALFPGVARGAAKQRAIATAIDRFTGLMIEKAREIPKIIKSKATTSKQSSMHPSQAELQNGKIEKSYDRVTIEDLTNTDGGIPDYVFDLWVLGGGPDPAPSPTSSR